MTAAPIDGAQVYEALAALDRDRSVQHALVEALGDLLDAAERTLTAIDRRIADLRAHPTVVAALERNAEQAVGRRYRDPGEPWRWLESVAGGHVIDGVAPGTTLEAARDATTGRVYVAPVGTLPPLGPDWQLARITIPGPHTREDTPA